MEEKIVAAIPIYSTSKKIFEERWDSFFEKSFYKSSWKEFEKEEYFSQMKHLFFPRQLWKYNRIIGYIEIIVSPSDIIFELYLCVDKKRFHFQSRNKDFIRFSPTIGLHFPIMDKNNEEIKEEIGKYLKMIEKDFIPKNRYIDYSVYDIFIQYFDLRAFINNEFDK